MTILENLPRTGGPITKTLPMDGLLNHSEHAVKRNAYKKSMLNSKLARQRLRV